MRLAAAPSLITQLFFLLFCCKHCWLQHNTHPKPSVYLYLQMSLNYNCERFTEGKVEVKEEQRGQEIHTLLGIKETIKRERGEGKVEKF